MGEGLKSVVMHEMGHILGLRFGSCGRVRDSDLNCNLDVEGNESCAQAQLQGQHCHQPEMLAEPELRLGSTLISAVLLQ